MYELRCADKIGNLCRVGGAPVECASRQPPTETQLPSSNSHQVPSEYPPVRVPALDGTVPSPWPDSLPFTVPEEAVPSASVQVHVPALARRCKGQGGQGRVHRPG